jgi:hypothetical protein
MNKRQIRGVRNSGRTDFRNPGFFAFIALAPAKPGVSAGFKSSPEFNDFSSLQVEAGWGEGASLPAAGGNSESRLSSGLCWKSESSNRVGQWKGQSQRWSIDVNKTNSR